MIIFEDIITGNELCSDAYSMTEICDGFFYEVPGKWVVVGDVDVDIGANPSAEGGEGEEGVDPSSKRVVDIVDAFRLQEAPSMDKKSYMAAIKTWLGKVVEKLPEGQKDEFKGKAQDGIKYILGMLKDLQFYLGESYDEEGTLVYCYYKEGAVDPTFLYPKYALKAVKC